MKTAAELHYLQHPVGAQLLPSLAQRAQLRRRIALVNLPRLRDLFGRRKVQATDPGRDHAASNP